MNQEIVAVDGEVAQAEAATTQTEIFAVIAEAVRTDSRSKPGEYVDSIQVKASGE